MGSRQICLALCLVSLVACSKAKPPVLAPLGSAELPDGCGCMLWPVRQPVQSYYWNDYGDRHYVNVDGKDLAFTHCKQDGAQSKTGDRHTLRCQQHGMTLRVDFLVTSECGPEDEGCEYTKRNAALSVEGPGGKTALQLIGGCGC